MPHQSPTRRLAPVALAVSLSLATAACGTDDSSSSTPGETTSSASQESPTSPSSSPSPTVQPATGPVIDSTALRVRIPRGWEKSTIVATLNQAGTDPRTLNRVDILFPPYWGDPEPLPRQAREAFRIAKNSGSTIKGKATFLEPVTIAGVPMYHYTYRGTRGITPFQGERYGAQLPNGQQVGFNFEWHDQDTTEAEREEIKESIFATIRWKGFTP